jgi:4a-hydroxytetrahydrobiopterin dehydratase
MPGMDDATVDPARELGRRQASGAVSGLGWRYMLGALRTRVRVDSLAQAVEAGARACAACGEAAGRHLRMDVRPDLVEFTLQSLAAANVTEQDAVFARQISLTLADLGMQTSAEVGTGGIRSAQMLEIAIDAADIAAIRPFWKAVMGYGDEADRSGPEDPLVDPLSQGPAIWFQQMDAARAQRNRIHFDVSVPHDEARRRVRAALDAGGALVSDARAPAFWVLADAEGNEACVTTWQGRDS